MMVIDSSAWIEWIADSAAAPRIEPHLPNPPDSIVPTIVQLEMFKWLARERGRDEAATFIGYTRGCVVIELTTSIAIRAAELFQSHKLATADSIIYATALDQGASLLTCDAHFEGLEHVIYVPKLAT